MFESLERIQIISIIGSLSFLFAISHLIRTKMLKEAYAILWFLFGAVFIIFSIWKKGLDFFAALVGVYYPPALLFLILIIALVLILIQFSVVISSQNEKIRVLCQELALLKLGRKDEKKESEPENY
ncbi:MAG: hypothetical protein ACD_39C01882G0003 [uncultured bacterium]|nr:MAG: hypothetical protein ACD_39C01882G0003 [uncultured bacterium]